MESLYGVVFLSRNVWLTSSSFLMHLFDHSVVTGRDFRTFKSAQIEFYFIDNSLQPSTVLTVALVGCISQFLYKAFGKDEGLDLINLVRLNLNALPAY